MRIIFRIILVAAAIGCGTAPSNAQWIRLFDGKSLDGWLVKAKPADREKQFWTAIDGAILCDSMGLKDHDYVWLVNNREFGDFELRMKVQGYRESSGNTGVQFRSRYDDATGWMNGPQVDIHPPAPWRTGLIYDETREARRWIFPSLKDWNIAAGQGPKSWKWRYADEGDGWNTVHIIANGTRIRTEVNGLVIADFDASGILDDAAHRTRGVGLKGRVALQLHTGDELRVRFKEIEVRPLP